jgi:heparan-sulfate lyase
MKKYLLFVILIGLSTFAHAEMVPYSKRWDVKLESLDPADVLGKLDLSRPGLEAVKAAADKGDRGAALAGLLEYYRRKFPRREAPPAEPGSTETADRICRHVFQWGPYEPADYGADIDWAADPADDIEWVAAIQRFYWADDLSQAYRDTRDDKYARAFFELTTDWIAKHPLEDWTRTHPKYTRWKGFAWLDLQTGIRATKAVSALKTMVHSPAITPDFLGRFLASMYDHQHKTERVPMGMVHNKAIFEQRGVMNVCHAFPEFKDTSRWAGLALERSRENLLAQTTTGGVQREMCGSYHRAVLTDAIDIMQKAEDLGLSVPEDYRRRVRKMSDYVFAVATPDLGWPMFGDTARSKPQSNNRRDGSLYGLLTRLSDVWDDPKYAARAELDRGRLPKQTSYAFGGAGLYVMRSDWGPEGIYFALHCPPPPLSGHDQPDNGTFELYAYGRWLMTDTGYYTYGHDQAARNWHRETQRHQTLTLDRKDTRIDGKLRLWHTSPELDALVVENPSYNGLVHRRTVWFVDKRFFVILDEAIGQRPGTLRLHWQPATGPTVLNRVEASILTQFPDANVLIHTASPPNAQIEQEDGWFAWTYGKREPRKTFSVRHPDPAPASFVTFIVPYQGTQPPRAKLVTPKLPNAGADTIALTVLAFGDQYQVGRTLTQPSAWSRREPARSAHKPGPPD